MSDNQGPKNEHTQNEYDNKYDRAGLEMWSGGMLAANVIILQVFLSASKLDTPSLFSVYAIAISIPTLAVGLSLNLYDRYRKPSVKLPAWVLSYRWNIFYIGVLAGFTGLIAAFWHISWVAGVVFIASGIAALVPLRN